VTAGALMISSIYT